MNPAYAIILVDSTGHALRVERILKQHALTCKLIPVPRHLSSDCGVCVRIFLQDAERAHALLVEERVAFVSIEPL